MQFSCNMRSVRHGGAKRASLGRKGVAAAALATSWGLLAGSAVADVHDWTGAVNTSFHNSGNWNIGITPTAGDSVIILGGSNNILLFADSPNLSSLYIGGNRDFSNNGHVLDVTNGFNTTTVSGVDSSLFLVPSPDPVQFFTDELTIQSNGLLDMQGGWAVVYDQLMLTGDGRIRGHGFIDLLSGGGSSLNGIDAGPLTVLGGDLHIRNLSGGGMALPNEINILQDNTDLMLLGTLTTDLQDVNLGAGAGFGSTENRTFAGAIHVDTGGGDPARIFGDASVFIEGSMDIVNSGHLLMEDPMLLESTADVWISATSMLEVDTWYNADAGSQLDIALGGHLKLDGPNYASGWAGDIDAQAAIIEVNSFNNMHMYGTMTLSSFFSSRCQINGSNAVIVHGQMSAPGAGAIFNGEVRVVSGGQLSTGASSVIDVNGNLTLFGGSNTIGGGEILVNDGGEFIVEETAYVGADVTNQGTMTVGSFNEVDYIYIDGTFEQSSTGRVELQFGGPTNPERDIIETAGTATLAGELNIELVDGFEPVMGESYEIIWANGGASGTFDSITGEPGFSVVYGANTVLVTYDGVPPCPGDTDGNGVVDVTDLLALLAAWGPCGEVCPADFDGSGTVDVTDLLTLLANWGACE